MWCGLTNLLSYLLMFSGYEVPLGDLDARETGVYVLWFGECYGLIGLFELTMNCYLLIPYLQLTVIWITDTHSVLGRIVWFDFLYYRCTVLNILVLYEFGRTLLFNLILALHALFSLCVGGQ
eukprot:gene3143-2125_t